MTKEYRLPAPPSLPPSLLGFVRLAGVTLAEQRSTDRKIALDGVSFTITEGERVGIIGENGAGKSTLLQLLAGVATPTQGAIEVQGRVHAALTIGLVLREDLTGRENLYLDAEIQGRAQVEVDAVIEEMIAFAELGDFIDQPVRTYSSGMKARLAFTSLVFVEPEILLIDEVLSVGDYWFAQKAARAVHDLCAKGRIVVLVSHSLESIVGMCSRCLWLDQGRLIADGYPAEITAAYRERIRQRDEAEMMAKFTLPDAGWSVGPAARISRVAIGSRGQDGPATVLFDGDEAWIVVRFDISRPPGDPDVRLRIERLDGLQVTENRWSEAASSQRSLVGQVELVAELGSLMLGPGLYRAHVELLDGETTLAASGTVFKVLARRSLSGGEPVLRAPIVVTSRPARVFR